MKLKDVTVSQQTAVPHTNPANAEEKGLAGKVTLVLSSDSENGRSLIRNLAAKGSDIVFVCLNGITQKALHLQAEVEALGQRCLVMVGDLRSWRFSQLLMRQIAEVFGHLDAFVDYSAQADDDDSEPLFFPHLTVMTAALKYIGP